MYCQYALTQELNKRNETDCSMYCQYALAQEVNKRNETLYTIHYVRMHISASATVCDNRLGVHMKHAIVVDDAAADSAAIDSGTKLSKGRIERGVCISHEYGGSS